jgi:acetolactate synthase I/II/III large subunit
MMRVADYIAQTLVSHGITDVFMVTGGGAMHLNDAIGRHRNLRTVCCHHEQACAMAAESYFRLTGRLAAVNVTSGPGGTNAITGVYGAFVDSLGLIVISGQVKWETLVRSTDLPLRQLGDQELDIIPMVQHITKYAVMVTDPQDVRYHLERALHLATSGRPGPVWVDVPLNIQGAQIDPDSLRAYDPAEDQAALPAPDQTAAYREVARRVSSAARPVVLVGTGVRISGMQQELLDLIAAWGVPIVTAWNAHDLVPDDDAHFAGRPGTIGTRAGNFAVQNADVVLVLGCRLNIRQVSYAWNYFARTGSVIMVDVDPAELRKPTLTIDLGIHADLHTFIPGLQKTPYVRNASHAAWVAWCRDRYSRYPACLPEYRAVNSPINPYAFVDVLSDVLADDDIIVTGDGTACVVTFQTLRVRRHQRLYTNSGCASMGYDLPAALGAAIAAPGRRVICLAGDGSLQMNLQELQTVVGLNLPIKVIVLNNQGYHSIRQTQHAFFADSLIGFDEATGVHFAPLERLAHGFGLAYLKANALDTLAKTLQVALAGPGPLLCEVMLDPVQLFSPKVSSKRLPDGKMVSAPLEDMAPFLPRDEFRSNMLVDPL